ncbi:MAG: glycoside hydrolase family 65 protein [Phycisphaerales bacterium]|nr:glycoside hydrolase family 65 protein [Phycisphaerales bacterium]
MPPTTWELVHHAPADDAAHEATLFTTSNGYLATRGTHPEETAGLPGLTIAGLFTDDAHGFRTLVTAGHWLALDLRAGRRLLSPRGRDVMDYSRTFDLQRGLVRRCLLWTPQPGLVLRVETEHFCSLADRRCAAQQYCVTCLAGTTDLRLRATVASAVLTRGAILVDAMGARRADHGVLLTSRTRTSEYQLALHATLQATGCNLGPPRCEAAQVSWAALARLKPGQSLRIEKLITAATSRDCTAAEVAARTNRRGYTALRRAHVAAWAGLWQDAAIELDGPADDARALHFVTAQLLAHAPRDDDRVSLGAKPLCPEGYRGHVFWDTDLFMTPALLLLRPELGRRLTNYRWETLAGAQANAAAHGYRGAWYPWESADDGREVTPRFWLRADGRRMPITCWKYEIHATCAAAYAVWEDYLATGDMAWLATKGLDVLFETARFWISRSTWVPTHNRFEIHDVCGPDECHERVNNSAYINTLASWTLARALSVLSTLRRDHPREHLDACKRLAVTPKELALMRRVARRMYTPRASRTGWIRQFDGFEELRCVDPQTALERFPRLAQSARVQVVKQADVLMLLYLLRGRYSRRDLLTNWDYYVPRTQHNSSLSAGTHAALAAQLGLPDTALRYFREAARVDLENRRGDSGRGLHGAALGGTLCAVLCGFGGVRLEDGYLVVEPFLPTGWQRLRIPFQYRGRQLLLDLAPTGFTLALRAAGPPLTVASFGKRQRLTARRPVRGRLLAPLSGR